MPDDPTTSGGTEAERNDSLPLELDAQPEQEGEESSSEDQENGERSQPRARNVIVSVIAGILVYVVVVGAIMVAGVGGLVVQIPALILAVVLGRLVYARLRGGKETTGSGPRPKLDRDERARRLSR